MKNEKKKNEKCLSVLIVNVWSMKVKSRLFAS